jgi:cobalamin biosynthesis Mg chelatase CobN
MSKLDLTDYTITNDTSFITALNNNNALIETALENTLSRDGTSPNTMVASLDMNSNRILNLPAPVSDEEPARLVDIGDAIDAAVSTAADLIAIQALVDSTSDISSQVTAVAASAAAAATSASSASSANTSAAGHDTAAAASATSAASHDTSAATSATNSATSATNSASSATTATTQAAYAISMYGILSHSAAGGF